MSCQTGTFDSLNVSLNKHLKQTEGIDEISRKFSKLTSDQQRVAFVLDIPAVHDLIHIPSSQDSSKSQDRAKQLKDLGNNAFKIQDYKGALALYTESIAWAPVNGESDVAGVAYANRSATLYHRGDYQACLQDIEHAIKCGYPEKLLYKVLERKARCLKELGDLEGAKKSFTEAKEALTKSVLAAEKIEGWQKDIDKQLETMKESETSTSNGPSDKVDDSKAAKMPSFGEGCNKTFTSLASACDVTFKPGQGRFITAVRDIEPGEVILVEKPFASVLLPSNSKEHCHHCFVQCDYLIPCDSCPTAKYCSNTCKEKSWNTYHQYECPILNTVYQSGVGKFGHLALRTVAAQSYASLMDFYKGVKEEKEGKQEEFSKGCSEDGTYKWDDYNSIYHLVTHAEDRAIHDLFRRAVMAVYLLKCLQTTSYFNDAHVDDDCLSFIGGLLLSHLQSFPCNAHEVPELYLDPNSVATAFPMELGAGIYSTLSLFNHSCDPTVNRNFYGDVCVVRAIKRIPQGSEVSDNYGAVYAVQTKKERQDKLAPQYYFECQCVPCVNDWPLYPDIPYGENPKWKCSNCQTNLGSDNCNTKCASCEQGIDIPALKEQYTSSLAKYHEAFDALFACDIQAALPSLLEHLLFIELHIVSPWRGMNDCQEAIKQCYSMMGNCVHTNV